MQTYYYLWQLAFLSYFSNKLINTAQAIQCFVYVHVLRVWDVMKVNIETNDNITDK